MSAAAGGRRRLDGLRAVVALYYYAPYVSGLSIYAQRLAEDLAARGARVTVVTSRHESGLPRRERIAGVEVVRCRPLARIDKGVVAPGIALGAVARGWRADVVLPVIPFAEAGALAWLLPRARVLPIYVCDLRLGPGPPARAIERLAALSARAAVSRAPRFVALSHDYVSASRVVGDLAGRAVAVAPPVEPERFARRPDGPLRERLGLGERPVVGFVGRIVFEKGLPVLLRAMRRVRERFPEAVLAIAGEGRAVAGGGTLDELEREIAGDPGVILTGHLEHEDLLAFYSMCSALALPSIDPLEAFGMVQVEAMLCGCPVVASDLPGVRLPVRATGMGRLAPPGDAEALAAALVAVMESPPRVERAAVAAALDPQASYAAMAEAVAETAGRRRRR